MSIRNTIFIIVLWVTVCGSIKAQIVTDRPDQTESSSTVPKGALQLESGILIGYEDNNQQSTRQILLPTNLFRLGITNWIELRLLNQLELLKIGNQKHEGISDFELGAKIQLLKKEQLKTEIAFLSHLIIPTGTKELTSDKYGTLNKLCISHGISENFNLGFNIGYNYFGEGNGDLNYSLAFGIGINEKVGIYAEPYGEFSDIDEFVSNFDAGITYLVNPNLQFDFSFGTGVNQTMNYISIGCSWLIEKE